MNATYQWQLIELDDGRQWLTDGEFGMSPAAAPQLYAALEAAQNWLREYHTQYGSPMDEGLFNLDDQVQAALAAARGE